jgi:mRNA interferase MazF
MVNKWDIRFCSLDPTQGSEQRGIRPVIIVSNNAVNHALPVCTVIPLSSLKQDERIYPTEVLLPGAATGLPKDSVAMVQQVRTVARARLQPPVGRLEDEGLRESIRLVIRQYFEV